MRLYRSPEWQIFEIPPMELGVLRLRYVRYCHRNLWSSVLPLVEMGHEQPTNQRPQHFQGLYRLHFASDRLCIEQRLLQQKTLPNYRQVSDVK